MASVLAEPITAAKVCDVPMDIVDELLLQIAARPDLWKKQTLRQSFTGSAHHDTESIYLRWAPHWTIQSIFGSTEAVDQPYEQHALPMGGYLILRLAVQLKLREIGRCMIVRLPPGGHIDRHIDQGVYADHYFRWHLVLAGRKGNVFAVGDDHYHMRPGEVWWFDHQQEHEVHNASRFDRIHLIIDGV